MGNETEIGGNAHFLFTARAQYVIALVGRGSDFRREIDGSSKLIKVAIQIFLRFSLIVAVE